MTTTTVSHQDPTFVDTQTQEHSIGTPNSQQPLGDIVVGVDGTPESFAALQWALHVAGHSGQRVNAVYGWAHSWDKSAQENNDDEWKNGRHEIAQTLRHWVEEASEHIDFNPENLQLTSVKASGSQALLQIGADAQQIVVGRRTMSRIARWFFGSLSNSLIEEAQVPVTVVRCDDDPEIMSVQESIVQALTTPEHHGHYANQEQAQSLTLEHQDQLVSVDNAYTDDTLSAPALYKGMHLRPIVVGVDGSKVASRALAFAAMSARIEQRPLHIMFFWQIKDLASLSNDDVTVPSLQEGQQYAEEVLAKIVDKAQHDGIFDDVAVVAHAYHISAGKGLTTASAHANRIIVGSRGLTGIDAEVLGSVSKQILDAAQCTVTVVH